MAKWVTSMNERFKQVALRWLELRDSPGARPSLDAFCAAEFPGDTAQQKSLLIQLDRFDEALQHWIEPSKEEAPKIGRYHFLDQMPSKSWKNYLLGRQTNGFLKKISPALSIFSI